MSRRPVTAGPQGAWRRPSVVVGIVVLLVSALTVIQVRSQAEVARSLNGQDNTSLAFLIDGLHSSNEQLAQEAGALAGQRDQLRSGGSGAIDAQLNADAGRFQIAEGLGRVAGPGVSIRIDAPLNEIDLQDAVNNLRIAGAEAIAVSDRRVVTGTVIQRSGGSVTIDAVAVQGPWVIDVIGDPSLLVPAADQMTRSLRSDPRVKSAIYEPASELTISAALRQRPFVYALSQ